MNTNTVMRDIAKTCISVLILGSLTIGVVSLVHTLRPTTDDQATRVVHSLVKPECLK